MERPPDSALLDAWEKGRSGPAAARAVALLEACGTDTRDALARMPLGRRDVLLLELHALLFGSRLEARLACPGCGEELELDFDADELPKEPPLEESLVELSPYRVVVRPLCTADLVAVESLPEHEAARALLERCVLRGERASQTVGAAALPEQLAKEIAARLEQLDPGADLRVATRCPACAHRWSAPLDVAAFVWAEVDHYARRLLRSVDALARAYGWSEAAILSLSADRRAQYLELAGS